MIKIFTDMTLSDHRAYATCFILTDKQFISCNTHVFENVRGTVHGELLAISFGIKEVKNHIDKYNDSIILFSDSKEAIQHINTNNTKSFKTILGSIKDETKDLNIEFQLIKGHAREHNPNKLVDLMSNSMKQFT